MSAATVNVTITPVALDEPGVRALLDDAEHHRSGPRRRRRDRRRPDQHDQPAVPQRRPRSGHLVYWQVVEFTNAADINVQRGRDTMTGTTLSARSRSARRSRRPYVPAHGVYDAGTGSDIGARPVRAQLTNSNTITFDRSISGSPDAITEIAWQVVELKDGSSVQSGTATSRPGRPRPSARSCRWISPGAIAFCPVQVGGQSLGRSPTRPTTCRASPVVHGDAGGQRSDARRNSTLAAADASWFVVQFAGGTGFKVGSFTKATGTAPASQSIAHGLGEVPEGADPVDRSPARRTVQQCAESPSTGIHRFGATGVVTLTLPVPAGTTPNDVMVASVGFGRVRPCSRRLPAGRWSGESTTRPGRRTRSRSTGGRLRRASRPTTAGRSTPPPASAGGIQIVRGCRSHDPVDVEAGAATATAPNHAAPSVTTTAANDMIVTSHSFAKQRDLDDSGGNDRGVRRRRRCGSRCAWHVGRGQLRAAGRRGRDRRRRRPPRRTTATPATRIRLRLRAAPAGTAYFGFGMTDGTTSRSVSTSSQDVVTTSNASTRMAAEGPDPGQWGEVAVAEADLSSWNDTSFTLNWTTNDSALVRHPLHRHRRIGRAGQGRRLDDGEHDGGDAKTVTGVGFQPDVVLNAHGGFSADRGAAVVNRGRRVRPRRHGLRRRPDGRPRCSRATDNSNTSDTQRGQQTDAALFAFNQN